MANTRDLIFVSYSHRDKEWLDKLFIFLKPYQRKGQFSVWADPYIHPVEQGTSSTAESGIIGDHFALCS